MKRKGFGIWRWGKGTRLDCPVVGLPLAIWWAREYDRGLVILVLLGPWYAGVRFLGDP